MDLKTVTKQSLPLKAVQFGEGNFLRGFADYMIDIANEKGFFGGSIAIVKPRQGGSKEIYDAQSCNYTVLLRGKQNGTVVEDSRIVTSISTFLRCYEDYTEYLALAEEESLTVVISNTTEAGITCSDQDRFTDTPPVSYPAKLCQFLHHRYKTFNGDFTKGLTLLPTELIPHNGDTLKSLVLSLAKKWGLEEAFLSWLKEACVFCNTLVDRIVSGYPKEEAEALAEKWGYEDKLTVVGEPFALWVIESPKVEETKKVFPLHTAGLPVLYTDSLDAYEERKVRVLNGAHTSMVPAAFLAGEAIVYDCMKNKVIRGYLDRVFSEILPYVPLERSKVETFAKEVIERFENPFLQHRLLAIALNSVSKWKARVLPSLKDSLKGEGKLPECLTFSFGALLAFYTPAEIRGKDLFGKRDDEKYPISDTPAVLDFFRERKDLPAEKLVYEFASRSDFWGEDLTAIPDFTCKVTEYYKAILTEGSLSVMERLTKKEESACQ